MTPDALVYENDVYSVFISGDHGEYELLAYHYPLIGIMYEGDIIINWRESISLNEGIVKFFANDCIILIQQKERPKAKKKEEEDDFAYAEENDE